MNFIRQLNDDIARYEIPFSCKQCTRFYDCHEVYLNGNKPHCHNFVPSNIDIFLNDIITHFELNIPKSKQKRLSRVCGYNGATNDKITTLDTYYVGFINDNIKEISKGHTVYIFNVHQLYDIVKFCRGFVAKYLGDGIIALKQQNDN